MEDKTMKQYFFEIKLYKGDTYLFTFLIEKNDLPNLIKALPEKVFGMVIINGIEAYELNTDCDIPLITFTNSICFNLPFQRTIKED